MTEDLIACVSSFCVLLGLAVKSKRKRGNKRRKWWVKPWIKLRPISGAYASLVEDLLNSDQTAFRYLATGRVFCSCCCSVFRKMSAIMSARTCMHDLGDIVADMHPDYRLSSTIASMCFDVTCHTTATKLRRVCS